MLPSKALITSDFETNIYSGILNRPIYICEALPGNTDSSQRYWRIRRFFYSGITRRNSSIRWADGKNEFAFIADDRATYTYSNSI